MSLNQLLVTMLSVGGFGFLNFVIADNIGTVEFKNYSTPFIVGYSILWSILDVFIFDAFKFIFINIFRLNNQSIVTWVSMGLTLTFVVFITPVMALVLEKWMNVYYSYFRNKVKSDLTLSLRGPLLTSLVEKHDLVYIFDLDHKLLAGGLVSSFNPDYFEFEFFDTGIYKQCVPSYDLLMKTLTKTNELVLKLDIACVCYINVEQKCIVIQVPKKIVSVFNKILLSQEVN